MLTINYANSFKKDYKLIKKRGYDLQKLNVVLDLLAAEQRLPHKYRNHQLVGNYIGYYECHIEPDWLLIYKIVKEKKGLLLARTGSHSDLY